MTVKEQFQKIFSNKLTFFVILLSVALIGVVIYAGVMHSKLYAYEEQYALTDQGLICEEHERQIAQLETSVNRLRKQMETKKNTEYDSAMTAAENALKKKYNISNDDYISRLHIENSYYRRVNDTTIEVLSFADISISSKKYGNFTQSKAYLISTKYDEKWTVNSIKQADAFTMDDFYSYG